MRTFGFLLVAILVMCTSAHQCGLTNRFSDLKSHTDQRSAWISMGWTENARAASSELVEVLFAIKHDQTALNHLEWFAQEVSDPKSPHYGQHATQEEVANWMHSPHRISAIRRYLITAGLAENNIELRASLDYVSAKMTVAQAEEMFRIQVHEYSSKLGTTPPILKSKTLPTLPYEISNVVDGVYGPLFSFPPLSHKKRQQLLTYCTEELVDEAINRVKFIGVAASDTELYFQFQPRCLNGGIANSDLCASSPPSISTFKVIQQVNGTTVRTSNMPCNGHSAGSEVICQSQTKAYAAFQLVNITIITIYDNGKESEPSAVGDAIITTPFVDAALNTIFYGLPKPHQRNGSFAEWRQSAVEFSHNFYSPVLLDQYLIYNSLSLEASVTVHGPNNPDDPEGEADQDMQWIMGTGQLIDTVFWSTANRSGFILEWQEEVAATPDAIAPKVYSVSYGQPELLVAPLYGFGYARRSETEFQKMAARGMSVTVADGDSGASSALGCDRAWPDWPATSAWVTSCGGGTISSYNIPNTAVAVGSNTGVAYTTGGGFSYIFDQPSYQASVVASYLTNSSGTVPPPSYFNASKRAFPDILTLGYNMETFYAGQAWLNPFPGGGTSFSAPLAAGMISILNRQRYNSGLSPMGFANPFLYQMASDHPDTFFDVVIGDNKCVLWGVPCCQLGYECVPGFDPVSGLGSPHFEQILAHLNDPFN